MQLSSMLMLPGFRQTFVQLGEWQNISPQRDKRNRLSIAHPDHLFSGSLDSGERNGCLFGYVSQIQIGERSCEPLGYARTYGQKAHWNKAQRRTSRRED